jgi:hypothetical protein
MLLIDTANVVGPRPTGWWRDRAATRRLAERVRTATAASRLPEPVVMVVEGTARQGVDEGAADGVTVVHAPGDGDDTLASVAATADTPVVLVSADRGLRARVRGSGAEVVASSWLLDRLGGDASRCLPLAAHRPRPPRRPRTARRGPLAVPTAATAIVTGSAVHRERAGWLTAITHAFRYQRGRHRSRSTLKHPRTSRPRWRGSLGSS